MAARKRPTPEDTAAARKILLRGLARDAEIFDLMGELAPLHPRDNTFPGEVRSYQLHTNAYVVKPIDAGQFSAAIGQIDDFFLTLAAQPQ
jgi:uncharacterized membrane protein YkvA (DUF1232 family)